MFNQTLPKWLKGHTLDELGTAIYLWQVNRAELGESRSETCTQVTYEQCLIHYFELVDYDDEVSLGFRWMPHRIMSEEDMLKPVVCARR